MAEIAWRRMRLSGWGRALAADMDVARPERMREVADALRAGPLVARGAGRAYGDAAIAPEGRALLTIRLDRLVSFDAASGLLVAEAGVTFADLLATFLPRGWLVPVSPGTGYATLGGALAADVHGKNHDVAGSFGDHVAWFDLMLPDGTERRIEPARDPALFAATVGGMGLTGIVLRLALTMQRVPGNAAQVRDRRVPDLEHFLIALAEAEQAGAPYSVGWIDALATGATLGRGILSTAAPAPASIAASTPKQRKFPIDLPGFVLNRTSIGLFNRILYDRIPAEGRETTVPWGRFLYPLDTIGDFNRMYGKAGFDQLQCVVPRGEGPLALRQMLEAIAAAGNASFLAVLKTLGGEGKGMLSFPMRGFTLALDIPRKPDSPALLARLERLTLDHGGRIYLAKDSALSPTGFAAMYKRLPEFREVLERVDPGAKMSTALSRRLQIRGVA